MRGAEEAENFNLFEQYMVFSDCVMSNLRS